MAKLTCTCGLVWPLGHGATDEPARIAGVKPMLDHLEELLAPFEGLALDDLEELG